jgi:CcmD family protein
VRRVRRRLCGAVISLLLVISLPALSIGTMAFSQPAAQAVPDGFEPVTEVPPEEQIPAQPLVAGAYAFIWLAVLVYVGLLWRRLGAVQKELDALKRGSSAR